MTDLPNVVLVTVDSLRADHCRFMGYERNTTPTLDRMAEAGVVFENAITPGPTTPESTPAMFTGRYPIDDGSDTSASGRRERIRRHMESRFTLPERMQRLGYRTAAFTPNPWTSRYFGFDVGYDRFEDFMDEDRSQALWERILRGSGSTPVTALRLVASWLQRANTFKPWESFVDDVLAWIDSGDEPYFVWVFLLDVHFPYFSGRGHYSQSRWRSYEANLRLYLQDQDSPYGPRVHEQLVTAYDDSVRYADDFLDVLQRSTDDDTRVVVTADHGEGFGEHGTYGHHDELFEENIRVPLVVSGGPEATVTTPVSLRSLPELVTGVATGRWSSVKTLGNGVVGSRVDGGTRAAIRGRDWKFIQRTDGDGFYHVCGTEESIIRDSDLERLGERILGQWRTRLDSATTVSGAVAETMSDRLAAGDPL